MTLDIAALRRLHGEAVANKGGDFEIDTDEAFRIAFIEHAPALLDAAEERDRLRASLDVSRYVERTDAFLARAHAAEAQRDALLAAGECVVNACLETGQRKVVSERMLQQVYYLRDTIRVVAKEAP